MIGVGIVLLLDDFRLYEECFIIWLGKGYEASRRYSDLGVLDRYWVNCLRTIPGDILALGAVRLLLLLCYRRTAERQDGRTAGRQEGMRIDSPTARREDHIVHGLRRWSKQNSCNAHPSRGDPSDFHVALYRVYHTHGGGKCILQHDMTFLKAPS